MEIYVIVGTHRCAIMVSDLINARMTEGTTIVADHISARMI
jgi:hypothetical protein